MITQSPSGFPDNLAIEPSSHTAAPALRRTVSRDRRTSLDSTKSTNLLEDESFLQNEAKNLNLFKPCARSSDRPQGSVPGGQAPGRGSDGERDEARLRIMSFGKVPVGIGAARIDENGGGPGLRLRKRQSKKG